MQTRPFVSTCTHASAHTYGDGHRPPLCPGACPGSPLEDQPACVPAPANAGLRHSVPAGWGDGPVPLFQMTRSRSAHRDAPCFRSCLKPVQDPSWTQGPRHPRPVRLWVSRPRPAEGKENTGDSPGSFLITNSQTDTEFGTGHRTPDTEFGKGTSNFDVGSKVP